MVQKAQLTAMRDKNAAKQSQAVSDGKSVQSMPDSKARTWPLVVVDSTGHPHYRETQ